MIRWALVIVVGVVLGAIVHLTTIMILPRTATQDAYSRLSAIAPVNTVVPAVTGNVIGGQALSGTRGTWATTTDTTYANAWQRCAADGTGCAPIAAATGTSYKLTNDDIGKTIKLAVTATNPDGTATATSANGRRSDSGPRWRRPVQDAVRAPCRSPETWSSSRVTVPAVLS